MDRRIEDRGYAVIIRNLAYGLFGTAEDRRSGQDRRKHDLLAEAAWGLHKPDCSDSYMGVYDALNILITMMERRK